MKVLLAGAGSVGQVYGHHLQQGGAEVTFLVKPRHAASTRRGFSLYPLNRRVPRRAPVRLEGFEVVTSIAALAGRDVDVVWLCTSSPALRASDWVRDLGRATGDATVIGLQPGLDDPDFVARQVGRARVAWGVVQLIAYPGPLGAEPLPESGTVYWVPPLAALPFSGPADRLGPVLSALRAGGLRARSVTHVRRDLALQGPVLDLCVAALELSGWRLKALSRDAALLGVACRAIREAMAVGAHRHGVGVPWWARLVLPRPVRLLTRLAPHLLPLDLERYLRTHFTKVRAQTIAEIHRRIDAADEAGLSSSALRVLAERLDPPAVAEAR